MPIRATSQAGVFTDGSWLYTRNLVPGVSVYGETLHTDAGAEYRRWDANRSKLSAYLKKGGRVWPFRADSAILYLGAASGTTVSHLSDICAQGTIVAVEISARPFRALVRLAESRSNVLPVLGDAAQPEAYRTQAGSVDVLYQDVAQRNQESIFLRNADFLRTGGTGFLVVKSRSADVAADPASVFREAKGELVRAGLDIADVRRLDPHALDHAALVVRKA